MNRIYEAPKYDAVVPIGSADVELAAIALESLSKFTEAGVIFAITASSNFERLQVLSYRIPRLKLIDEDNLLLGAGRQNIYEALQNRGVGPSRCGWYLQQFLKMGAVEIKNIADHYLICDADTVFLRKTNFFKNEKILVHPSSEYHAPYFDIYRKLLSGSRVADFSFVSQHLMVKSVVMKKLIDAIGGHAQRERADWVYKIIENVDPQINSGFSEYETYGNFAIQNFPNLYESRTLRYTRSGSDLSSIPPNYAMQFALSSVYDLVTFEKWGMPHKTMHYYLKKIYFKIIAQIYFALCNTVDLLRQKRE